MKILITGAKGMLGTDMVKVLSDAHNCIGTSSSELDITDLSRVLSFVGELKPDIIINPACYTKVDACETNADHAYRVNALGARNMAACADGLNIPIVHISTDYVFDGEKNSPYLEGDAPNPLSEYGLSKLEGERFVRQLTTKHYIVRIQWLYGLNGGNFVKTILKKAREDGSLKVVNDQWGSPTYTMDVCEAVAALIKLPCYGTYHVTNSGVVTWYEFTKEIMKQAGLDSVTVTPCTTEEFPRPARRPRYSALENRNLRLSGIKPLRPYQEALSDYLKER